MPILINGEELPEYVIQEETDRLRRDLRWEAIADLTERAARIRQAAEYSAVNRMVLEQAAAEDPRQIDVETIEREIALHKKGAGCREAFDDSLLRQHIERHLRLGRLTSEFTANAPKPLLHEVRAFYDANRANFGSPDRFHAAHIVLHVNQTQTEEHAWAVIHEAHAALETGQDFASVVERFSDCKDNAGDLGTFTHGVMVEEFEAAIRPLSAGQRTGVFRTPFGFHIAELRERTTGGTASFEEVRPDIERVLAAVAEQREFLRGVADLRERADVRYVVDSQSGQAMESTAAL